MKTVSVDTARKLKASGFTKRLEYGDWFIAWEPPSKEEDGHYIKEPFLLERGACEPMEEDIWLPTLGDLLEWLEERKWEWVLKPKDCAVFRWIENEFGEKFGNPLIRLKCENTIEAAAQAVLWVLEQEAKP